VALRLCATIGERLMTSEAAGAARAAEREWAMIEIPSSGASLEHCSPDGAVVAGADGDLNGRDRGERGAPRQALGAG